MKKIVSLVLTIVLMASMFAMLGTVTASAETYYATNLLVNLTFDGDAPYGVPAHRGNFKSYTEDTDGNGVLFIQQSAENGAVFFIGKDGTVGETPVNAFSKPGDVKTDEFVWFEATKTYRVAFDYKYLKGTGEGAGLGNGKNNPYTPTGSNSSLIRLFTDPTKGHTTAPNNDATFGYKFEERVTVISQNKPTATWTPDESGQLGADTEWKKAEIVFTVKENDPGFVMSMNPGDQGITKMYYDNIKVQEVVGSYNYTDTGVYTMDEDSIVSMTATSSGVTTDSVTVTYENDPEKGRVAKVVGGNGGRAYIPGTPTLKENTKYYVTFDAKGITEGNYINLGMARYYNTGSCRMFFMGFNDVARGTKLYINGVETEIVNNFTNVTTEWQSYGVVIDTANSELIAAAQTTSQKIFDEKDEVYIFFGAQKSTVYFDNVKIVEVGAVPTVVPEKDESAKYSIRETAAGTTAGLRFRGSVANTVKETADEIGFVVAPASLVGGDANWYKLDSLNKFAKKAVAYDGTKDVVYAPGNETTSYQLILTGLDELAAQRFAAVMYVKTGNTYEYISLGEISYNQVLAEYAVRRK